MNTSALLDAEKNHLAGLLEAIQRCVYFLHASSQTLTWPLQGTHLLEHKKDNDLFESLAAINERFAKLQDTLGAAMRHSLVLSGDQADSFLKVLTIFENLGWLNPLKLGSSLAQPETWPPTSTKPTTRSVHVGHEHAQDRSLAKDKTPQTGVA